MAGMINWGAGLGALGESISKTAGVAALETLKSQLDTDRLKLADELAGTRESTGRAEQHGYAMMQQGARLAAEQPGRDALTAKYTSETAISNEEAARKRAAGDALAAGASGGGARENNIGNMRPVGASTGFQSYKTFDEGVAATVSNLRAYQDANGGKPLTLGEIGAKWAPKGDGANDPAQWAKNVGSVAGIDPNAPINLDSPETAAKLARGIHAAEWGQKNTKEPEAYIPGAQQAFGAKSGVVTAGGRGAPSDGIPAEFSRAYPKETIEIREKRAALVPSEARTAEWYARATPEEQAAFRATAPSYIYAKSREDVATTSAEAKKQVAEAQRNFKSSLIPGADALDSLAYAYNADRTLPTLGFGGAQGKLAIIERAAQIRKEQGISDADWMSGAAQAKASAGALGKLQQQQAAVEAFSATAEKNGELVKDLIAKGVGPTGMPIIDRWIQQGRRSSGDDDVGKFGAALYNYLTESAKVTSGAMGNTPLSDSARKEVQDFINKADNEKTILGVIDTMALERQNRMTGFSETIDRLKKQTSGAPNTVTQNAPGATFTNPNPAPAGSSSAAPMSAVTATPLSLPIQDGKIDARQLRGGAVYNTDKGLLRFDAATGRLMPIEAR